MTKKKVVKRFLKKYPVGDGQIKLVEINRITQNPYQTRRIFDPVKMKELEASISEYGVIIPVILRPSKHGYELVCGERRFIASRALGLKKIPAIIRNISSSEMLELAYIENVHRVGLNPIEKAESIVRMQSEYDSLSDEELAEKLGLSIEQLNEYKHTAGMHPVIKKSVLMSIISYEHANAISDLKIEEDILLVIKTIKHNNLSPQEANKVVTEFLKKSRGEAADEAD